MAVFTSKSTGRTYEIDSRGLAVVWPWSDDVEEYIPDEDGSIAFARHLEARAEAGTWFGR